MNLNKFETTGIIMLYNPTYQITARPNHGGKITLCRIKKNQNIGAYIFLEKKIYCHCTIRIFIFGYYYSTKSYLFFII